MPDYSNVVVSRNAPRWAWDKIDHLLAVNHAGEVEWAMRHASENPELEEVEPPIFDGGEFTAEYELVQHETVSFDEALKLAEGDKSRIWLVRHGDDEITECSNCHQICDPIPEEETEEGWQCIECGAFNEGEHISETVWDVELWRGQFVNCVGFFVTTEPCKPEHQIATFTY